jgi:hypothetical protein
VADLGDLVRMIEALNRPEQMPALEAMRLVVELDRGVGIEPSRGAHDAVKSGSGGLPALALPQRRAPRRLWPDSLRGRDFVMRP